MAKFVPNCIMEGVPAGLLWLDAAELVFYRHMDGRQEALLSLATPITNRAYGHITIQLHTGPSKKTKKTMRMTKKT